MTLAVPQVETGQGIWTGLAQIAADELGAAWENMAVEPAPHGAAYANRLIAHDYGVTTRITAGSTSIRAFEQPLREAAAVARAMLCEAAADRWGVSAAECDTEGGFVIHEGKRLGFGEVAAEAAALRPPRSAASCGPRQRQAGRRGAAAARPAGQIGRQPALCRRRPLAADDFRLGADGAAGRPADRLLARRRPSGSRG